MTNPKVKIKRDPAWDVTATLRLDTGQVLAVATEVRAPTMEGIMDRESVWDTLLGQADLDAQAVQALIEDNPSSIYGLMISVQRRAT